MSLKELLAKKLGDNWEAIDGLWRIELIGDTPLLQRWRVARNQAGEIRQLWLDFCRLSEYLERHGKDKKEASGALALASKPASSSSLRSQQSARGKAAPIFRSASNRTPRPRR